MPPSGFATRRSRSLGVPLMWNETVMATDTMAMYIDRRRYERKAIPRDLILRLVSQLEADEVYGILPWKRKVDIQG